MIYIDCVLCKCVIVEIALSCIVTIPYTNIELHKTSTESHISLFTVGETNKFTTNSATFTSLGKYEEQAKF